MLIVRIFLWSDLRYGLSLYPFPKYFVSISFVLGLQLALLAADTFLWKGFDAQLVYVSEVNFPSRFLCDIAVSKPVPLHKCILLSSLFHHNYLGTCLSTLFLLSLCIWLMRVSSTLSYGSGVGSVWNSRDHLHWSQRSVLPVSNLSRSNTSGLDGDLHFVHA